MSPEAFLRTIYENPEDDAPRLSYADWLDEHGQTDRADFIRVQLELARLAEDHPRQPELLRREETLLAAHRAEWLGELLQLASDEWWPECWMFHRGLRALDLYFNHIGDEGLRALASAPHLASLKVLKLNANDIGDGGACALASSPHLAALTELNLDGGAIGDEGARALAAAPHLATLAELDLCEHAIGDAGARALAASPHLAALSKLHLQENAITTQGKAALRARFGDRVSL